MSNHRRINSAWRAAAGIAVLLALSATNVTAHSITVTPSGEGDGFGPRPISKAWAQAHCNAASPGLVADASSGVVQFLPAGALTCPAVANPGGQVHP
jgi:hypothetical protein